MQELFIYQVWDDTHPDPVSSLAWLCGLATYFRFFWISHRGCGSQVDTSEFEGEYICGLHKECPLEVPGVSSSA